MLTTGWHISILRRADSRNQVIFNDSRRFTLVLEKVKCDNLQQPAEGRTVKVNGGVVSPFI